MPCRAYVAPCRRPCRATAEKTTTMHGSHNKIQDTRPGSKTYNTQLQAQRLQHSHTSVPHNIDRTKYIPTYIYYIYKHTLYIHMYTCIHSYMNIYDGPCRAPCRANPLLLHTLSREGRPGPVTYQKVLTHCHLAICARAHKTTKRYTRRKGQRSMHKSRQQAFFDANS